MTNNPFSEHSRTRPWQRVRTRSPASPPSLSPKVTRSFKLGNFWTRAILGSTAVFVCAASYWSYQTVRSGLLETLKDQAFLEVQQGVNQVDSWLSEHKVSMAASANNPVFRTMDWDKIEPYLKSEEQRQSAFMYFGMIDTDGLLYTTLADQPKGVIDLSDRAHIQSALTGKNSLSDPLIARIPAGKPIVAYAIPVWSGVPQAEQPLGEVIGMMNGVIGIDQIIEVINGLNYGDNSYAFALNSKGEAIVHPNAELMSTLEKPASSLLLADDLGLATIAQHMTEQRQGLELVNIDGIKQYVFYVPLTEADWSVALVIPKTTLKPSCAR